MVHKYINEISWDWEIITLRCWTLQAPNPSLIQLTGVGPGSPRDICTGKTWQMQRKSLTEMFLQDSILPQIGAPKVKLSSKP